MDNLDLIKQLFGDGAAIRGSLERYHRLEHNIIVLTGHDLEELKQLFAAGYTLEPPKSSLSLAELVELVEFIGFVKLY